MILLYSELIVADRNLFSSLASEEPLPKSSDGISSERPAIAL